MKYLPNVKIPENPCPDCLHKSHCKQNGECPISRVCGKYFTFKGQQSILSLLVEVGDIDEKLLPYLRECGKIRVTQDHKKMIQLQEPYFTKPFSEWLKEQKK